MRSARPVSAIAACSAASASGLRSVGPAMVSRQSRSFSGAERAHEDVAGLARHDRADAEQLQRSRRRARGARRGIGAGLGHRDLVGGHREVRNQRARGDAAGDDDPPGQRQRGGLQGPQRVLPRFGEPGLQAQRMVHERDDGRAHARDDLGRHGAIGQPVDHARRSSGATAASSRAGFVEVGRARIGKRSRQLQVAHRDAASAAAAPAHAGRTCSRRSAARCRPEWRRRRGSFVIPRLVIPVVRSADRERRSPRHDAIPVTRHRDDNVGVLSPIGSPP